MSARKKATKGGKEDQALEALGATWKDKEALYELQEKYPDRGFCKVESCCPCKTQCDLTPKRTGLHEDCTTCPLYEVYKDFCRQCHERKEAIIQRHRHDWISPAPAFYEATSGAEKFIGLSVPLIKKIGGLNKAIILTYIHFRTRVKDPDENGVSWIQITHKELSDDLKISRRTVWEVLKFLVNKDYLKTPPGKKKDKTVHWKGIKYSVNYDKTVKLAYGFLELQPRKGKI